MDSPDKIIIREFFVEEVPSTGAEITVTVKGSSFITGQTALTKAKEVATLVESLRTVGLPEEKISVESVRIQASSGPILKSSSASYTLRLTVDDMDRLNEILTVITGAKNISVDSLGWQYGDLEARKPNWIKTVMAQANARAKLAAAALGVEIVGVHECQMDYIGLPHPPETRDNEDFRLAKMMRYRTDFSIGIKVRVVYRLGDTFKDPSNP